MAENLVRIALIFALAFHPIPSPGYSQGTEGKCAGPECNEPAHSSIGQTARLLKDGLDGTVKLNDLRSFPNFDNPGENIDIAQKVAANDYQRFGTLLLNDQHGDYMNNFKKENPQNPIGVTTSVFTTWINGRTGEGPITWGTLLKIFRAIKLTVLADGIENFFKTANPSLDIKLPALCKNIKGKCIRVAELLQKLSNSATAIKESGIGEAASKMEHTLEELSRLTSRLQNGKVRVGIVGLSKAGKSTFLNALLGSSFLPTSVQPQTANETVIIHDMSKPGGELHCTLPEGSTLLAQGQEKIYEELRIINDEKRDLSITKKKCNQLILHAPLQFLRETEMEDVKLELSDTPGFGEAGADKIADTVNIAVKDLCAFILILNSDNMKSVSELKLLHELTLYHPELFSKRSRVLILVNGRNNIYSEGRISLNSASLTPSDVPSYVANYLAKKEFLGVEIPKEKIILFNALWALRSREWKNLKLDTKEAKLIYREAMLMLSYIGKDEEADKLREGFEDEGNIDKVISLLKPVSEIEEVESLLKAMVIENGGLVLLESAVDDTVSVIKNSMIPVIKELIESEHIEAKELEVTSIEQVNTLFSNLITQNEALFDAMHSSVSRSSQAQISTLHNTIRDSLSNVVSDRIMDGLREISQFEKKPEVVKEMKAVRDLIPAAVLTKMKTEWHTVDNAVVTSAEEQLRHIFSAVKTSFLSSLAKININGASKILENLIEKLGISATNNLDAALGDVKNLLPTMSSLSIEQLSLDSKAVQDVSIEALVKKGTKEKVKFVPRKVCGGGGWFGWGRRCSTVNDAVPYNIEVFSPQLGALKSTFDEPINSWMRLFDEQVAQLIQSVSISAGAAAKEKLSNAMEESRQQIADTLNDCRQRLERSKQSVSFLEEEHKELKESRKQLRNSI